MQIIVLFTVVIILLPVIYFLSKNNGNIDAIKIHDAILSGEDLEQYAKQIAFSHVVSNNLNSYDNILNRMNDNYGFIISVYRKLNDNIQVATNSAPAAEWLLDNFYIIEEQVKGIRQEFKRKFFASLPVIKRGPFKGYSRIYAIALEIVSHTDGRIDDKILINFIRAYQSVNSLTNRELWALGTIVRLALIESIRQVCEKILITENEWQNADRLYDNLFKEEGLKQDDKAFSDMDSYLKGLNDFSPTFVEHISYKLRRAGRSGAQFLHYLDMYVSKFGTTIDDIAQKQHNEQASMKVSIGNCIISLKFISSLDWIDIFKDLSQLETILNNDPANIYQIMDLQSKNNYREKIEKIAKLNDVSESHIATKLLECANENNSDKLLKSHVGYYLYDDGISVLEQKIGCNPHTIKRNHNPNTRYYYFGSICALTILLSYMLSLYFFTFNTASYLGILTFIISLIPSSELSICIINWIFSHIYKPSFLNKLELKKGVPGELKTFVVVPTLLSDKKRVSDLVKNLEIYYLANKDKNIYFALVGDYKDCSTETHEDDIVISTQGLEGIKALNEKYSKEGQDIFYFFLRSRKFNTKQNKWMGWERKRGALLELNELLTGSNNTSYNIMSTTLENIPKVKYVITLDADTVLPIDMAKKFIGTMAHPLNRPIIDESKGIVVKGYGLIQPRINPDIVSINKSFFSKVFGGEGGIDPYSCAASDIYMDLFGEGIFTGKGIYDLEVMEKILNNTLPENSILSHDLLEGSYVRVGLATDLELIDGYPSRYNSYAARLHRWVRGDWQLLPWLGNWVKNRANEKVRNPINIISKWKIKDNLRRSLVSPALMLLLILGFSVLPGRGLFILAFTLLCIGCPLVISIVQNIITRRYGVIKGKRHKPTICGIKALFYQTLLSFIFLPYMAYLMLHAVIITFARLFITKKNMLEWVTAADVEKKLKNDLRSFYIKMKSEVFVGILFGLLCYYYKPQDFYLGLILSIIFVLSPIIAYLISLDIKEKHDVLTENDINELRLISRKIWRYFDDFANAKNHFLPPDNYQEEPPNGIAYRTSPTNIGLGLLAIVSARDLGYICTTKMFEGLVKPLNTIEKLEKWNGHLYNWYDTRTLLPLIPRYVSTVDSGNLACYLITLYQALEQYLAKDLIDNVYLSGLLDNLSLLEKDTGENLEELKDMIKNYNKSKNIIDLYNLFEKLSVKSQELNIKKSYYKSKIDSLLDNIKKDFDNYFGWIKVYNGLDSDIKQDKELTEIFNKLVELKSLNQIKNTKDIIDNIRNNDIYNKNISLLDLVDTLENSYNSANNLYLSVSNFITKIKELEQNMSFIPLFDPKKQIFSIGYDIEENRLTNSYYDLLASEARQTSYLAVARGEVSPKHWFRLGRTLTIVDKYKGLISWSGTMFEYLMPPLIMKNYTNTLLDETYSFVIKSQIQYGNKRDVPWGVSESGFNLLDINLDYQYKAFGVPWLGLKRGLIEDVVIAPYATLIGIPFAPAACVKNINILKQQQVEGNHGLYEAVDYTPERIPYNRKSGIVRSYMAHHQGMSLLALNNYLNNNIMQRYFHSNPMIKSAELLLQEKIPIDVVYTKEAKEKIVPFKEKVYNNVDTLRTFGLPEVGVPNVHVLSNSNYNVMITDGGNGFSKSKLTMVTRYKEDYTINNYGMMFFIRNVTDNRLWSATYAPLYDIPDKYEVLFTLDKAKFIRMDGEVETQTEIIVSPEDNSEIRRITLINHGEKEITIEVTSYYEVTLTLLDADIAHPAFSNLFITTQFLEEYNAIVAHRKPRLEHEKTLYAINTVNVEGNVVGDIQFETDRSTFIGRNRNIQNPIVIEKNKPLSNTQGAVLDPIMSLRRLIRIEPNSTARISFVTSVDESREKVIEMVEKYQSVETVMRAFRLALTRSQVESRYLNMKQEEIELYQSILNYIFYTGPLQKNKLRCLKENKKGQSGLWPYGISGDLPIVLVSLNKSEEIDIVYEILKGHEYWKSRGLLIDLVILNNEATSYTNPLNNLLYDVISTSHLRDLLNKPGGVFVIKANNLDEQDKNLLQSVARISLVGSKETLEKQLTFEHEITEKNLKPFSEAKYEVSKLPDYNYDLDYFNELGGFSKSGKEYIIKLDKSNTTPAPWSNVISNNNFGTIISESGGGYTWCQNSRENKLTPWSNDPVSDPPGEIIYIQDDTTGELLTPTSQPIRDDKPYIVEHGFGYTTFKHYNYGITTEMECFVPQNENIKLNIINVKNISNIRRCINLTYYIKCVLGVSEQKTTPFIITEAKENFLSFVNNYNDEFQGKIAFISSSLPISSYTTNRNSFLGLGKFRYPDGLKYETLGNNMGCGVDPCGVLQVKIDLNPDEDKDIVFMLGESNSIEEITNLINKYKIVTNAKEELQNSKDYWNNILGTIRVKTPDISMNILLNGWVLYQLLSCRLLSRSAFYQSGGAYGFRDQLQDVLPLSYLTPEITRSQIIYHCQHQFKEGDVLHWWHPETNKGTRTRFSDDLLWLPYISSEYISITGDYQILNVDANYVESDLLKDFEDEKYIVPRVSDVKGSVYEHCIKSIEKSLKFGEHGLPLMGSGDWNDGMNTVGNKGKGESVWVGWFLYDTLRKFIPICISINDTETAKKYEAICQELKSSININAWDGNWYKRAYFDNGKPLGSVENTEAKIDSISQSWAIISGAGEHDKIVSAMNSLENYLIDRENGLIKLLSPPFGEGDLEPGYIKGYVPGVRENGGQYTHAASWVILAYTMLGDGDKAAELFDLINPINHTRTHFELSKYKVEPYVMAADVYSVDPHTGRGGWTWYTGTAGWIYRVGIENILGFTKVGNILIINPTIPKHWDEFSITYRYNETIYNITIKNPDHVSNGVQKVFADYQQMSEKQIELRNDKINHSVEIIMG